MMNKYLVAEHFGLEKAGEPELEKELCFLVRLTDSSELDAADETIYQEQWTQFGEAGEDKKNNFVRVRSENDSKFTLAIKSRDSKDDHYTEQELDITKTIFELMKRNASDGMIKTRYVFKHGVSAWEVDVFSTREGVMSNLVKVDYEYKHTPPSLDAFPLAHDLLIDLRSEEDRKKHKKEIDAFFSDIIHT